MVATVTLSQQNLEISGVGDVIVTDIQQDPLVGDYVRDIRVYDMPIADITLAAGALLLVQLRIRASTKEALELTAPPQLF